LDAELMLQLYSDMVLGRMFDERVVQIHARGLIPGSVFPGIGEEATFVGAVRALNRDDYMVSCHRGHAHSLAKGTDAKRLLAEMLTRRATTWAGTKCLAMGSPWQWARRWPRNV
jgi:TPP-dependent pyruvate/acetoin dehydrogenase alpha subunit